MDVFRKLLPFLMKRKIQLKLHKFAVYLDKLHKGKPHLDLITGLLTIPVLLSVIFLNYNNINNMEKSKKITPTPTPMVQQNQTPETKVIVVTPTTDNSQTITPAPSCKKDVGPVSITSPTEGQTISDNPVCITINYSDSNFCSVVWSYRINGGQWSDFNSNNPCIYNLPNGNVKFDLRVQSTVIQKETDLTRNFIYKSSTQNATNSATTSN